MNRNNLIKGGGGIGGITRNIESNIKRDNRAISNAFSDLQSLKEKSI
jgi:ESCRT-II complex subunit VPS36